MFDSSYKKRVAVLRGGQSSEYDVSIQTGANVLLSLQDLPYIAKDVLITKNGEWLVNGFVKTPQQALMDVDVVFLALHGSYGEDGTVQRILERLQKPFTGSGSYASAIAMNKALTKDYLKKGDVSILYAPYLKISREGSSNIAQVVRSITELFGPEYVIKPTNGGSSIGVTMTDAGGLLRSVIDALDKDEQIIVEQRIYGKEATVGVLENFRDQLHYALPEIEIVPPAGAGYFAAEVKYTGDTQELCPGRFSKEEKKMLADAALLVHRSLNLRQYSRSDFIVSENGVYFLEVNTLPGLTNQSLFPKSMEAVGSNYKELIDHLITTAS